MVYSDADTPGGESGGNDNGSDSEILEDSNFNPHKCLNKQPFSGDGSPGDSGATAEQITETTPEDGSNGSKIEILVWMVHQLILVTKRRVYR